MTKTNKEAMKTQLKAETAMVDLLTTTIRRLGKECNLDPERLQTAMSGRSEYGTINKLVNLLASKVMFPADKGDYANLAHNQSIVEKMFNTYLLEKIKNARGYHSFSTDEGIIIDGKPPKFEDYEILVNIFLEDLASENKLKLPKNFELKLELSLEAWHKAEEVERAKAEVTAQLIKDAIARTTDMLDS